LTIELSNDPPSCTILTTLGRGAQFGPERGCPFPDDRLALGQFLFPLAHVFPDDRFQVIDVVQVNVT
jgi:hypothetical protein